MTIEQLEKAKFLQTRIEVCKEKIKVLEKQKTCVGLFRDYREVNYELTAIRDAPSPTSIIDRLKINYDELEDVINLLLQRSYEELEYCEKELEKL